jgi:hypothetical protein
LIVLGVGILITPISFKIAIYNWLLNVLNLSLSDYPALSEIDHNYWIGFGLIIIALVYNIFGKWVDSQSFIFKKDNVNKIKDMDTRLFKKFLKVFSYDSRSAQLLKQHDFGNSFDRDSLNGINNLYMNGTLQKMSLSTLI